MGIWISMYILWFDIYKIYIFICSLTYLHGKFMVPYGGMQCNNVEIKWISPTWLMTVKTSMGDFVSILITTMHLVYHKCSYRFEYVLISSIWRIWPFSLSEMLIGVVLRVCIYKCPYVYISVCVYTVFCKKKK